MGRFYKTSKPEYLDFIYKQPKNLLLQAVQKASEGVDKNLAQTADLYGRLKSEALNPDVERRDEIIDAYKSKIDNLSNKIYENPMDYRGYTPDIKTLSDDIKDNLERGELAAISSNVTARTAYKDKLDAQVKSKDIDQTEADDLLNNYDAYFKAKKGTLYQGPSKYQTYSTGFISKQIDPYKEVDDLLQGMAADQTAWANAGIEVEISDGKYLLKDKGTKKYLNPEDVRAATRQILAGHQPINEYYNTRINQAISGFDAQRKLRDYKLLEDFAMNKFGFTQVTADKSVTSDPYYMAQYNKNLNQDATTATYNSEGQITKNKLGRNTDGVTNYEDEKNRRLANTEYTNQFNNQLSKKLETTKHLGKKAGVVPVKYINPDNNQEIITYIPTNSAKWDATTSKWIPEISNDEVGNIYYDDEVQNKNRTTYEDTKTTMSEEIGKRFNDGMNTGKWDGSTEYYKSAYGGDFSELTSFSEGGKLNRTTESVKREKSISTLDELYENLYKTSNPQLIGVSGGMYNEEEFKAMEKEKANFLNEIYQYNTDHETSTDLVEGGVRLFLGNQYSPNEAKVKAKDAQAEFNKKTKEGGEWAFDMERINSSQTVISPMYKYDEDGNPIGIVESDIEAGNMQSLMDAARILHRDGKREAIVDGKKVELTGPVTFGGGTPSETVTEIQFMVDGKMYEMDLGKLTYSYDEGLPAESRTGALAVWDQQVTLYATEENKRMKKGLFKFVTPVDVAEYTFTNGSNTTQILSNPIKVVESMADENFVAAENIAKNTANKLQELVTKDGDLGKEGEKDISERQSQIVKDNLPYQPITYAGLNADVNIAVRYEGVGNQKELKYYLYDNKTSTWQPTTKKIALKANHNDYMYKNGLLDLK